MKNKKGFTLVELLAVIVVLAIIMIVAVPSVLNSLESARKNTFKIYAQNMIKKATEVYQNEELTGNIVSTSVIGVKGTENATRNNCYYLSSLGLETGGKYSGSVWYNKDNKTFYVYLQDDTYYTYIDYSENEYLGLTLSELDNLDNIKLKADFENDNEGMLSGDFLGSTGRITKCGLGKIFSGSTIKIGDEITLNPRPTFNPKPVIK